MTAKERGTGKTESITITNDKGRLSKEEIDRMIHEAQKFAAHDKELKEKLDAKQNLEQYLYTMRATINDRDKLADKLEGQDKEVIKEALDEGDQWLRSNEESAQKEDFERELKNVQKVCDPIIAKMYQKYGG